MYTKKNPCYYWEILIPIVFAASCKCPLLSAPSVKASHITVYDSTSLILAVPHVRYADVYWQGPIGTHEGETWVIDTVNKSMSGTYSVWYQYRKRKRCYSDETKYSLNVEAFPQYPNPLIFSNQNALVSAGKTIILSVPNINEAEVYWTTPQGINKGNPLVIPAAIAGDSGLYSVKYVHNSTPRISSVSTSKSVYVYSRSIIANFNNKTYYVDFNSSRESVDIWLRADKSKYDINRDLMLAQVNFGKITLQDAKTYFCEQIGYISKSRLLSGCMISAGAAGCLLGSTEGLPLVPSCVVLLNLSIPGSAACLDEVGGNIAEVLGISDAADIGSTGAAIAKDDVVGALSGLMKMACSKALNKEPKINVDGTVTLVPTHSPPSTSKDSNKPDGGNGHEFGFGAKGNGGSSSKTGNGGSNSGGGNTGGGNRGNKSGDKPDKGQGGTIRIP
ncbi:hypothetical protein SAMN05428988_4288 [Chitinophaga sp. YR573]|uniref:hypothetical protein n=1 Tax=Chitinophaga sp. YR573 TaxID=1881040 RepID=UPI0008B4F359|nr:hypothetical protein [Chitinophaga sp. YR573]SEW35156.1 hypothetical protein SAMN05428988_4288 [Chitinophaga sp. YR573]